MTPQSETITWIPVSERLPETGDDLPWGTHYLVHVESQWSGKIIAIECWQNKEGHWNNGHINIIAWAELPKGYQPEGENGR